VKSEERGAESEGKEQHGGRQQKKAEAEAEAVSVVGAGSEGAGRPCLGLVQDARKFGGAVATPPQATAGATEG